jgi:hypothetical protein
VLADLFKIDGASLSPQDQAGPSVWREFFHASSVTGQPVLPRLTIPPANGGAWMVCAAGADTGDAANQSRLPLTTAWGGKRPALPRQPYPDVYEFGHSLHHMLTQVNERDVSGSASNGMRLNCRNQFMENFAGRTCSST